jgi:hypothetical protein
MSKISKSNFTSQHRNRAIDINKVDGNAAAKAQLQAGGMSVDQLRAKDTNNDGKIDTNEAWKIADDFDRDGNRNTLIDRRADGTQAPAGKALSQLGLLMQNNDVSETQTAPAQAPNDDILFVGMNNATRVSAGAQHEINKLRGRGNNVTAVTDSKVGDDKIKVGGTTYDLTTDDGRKGFANTLGLPAEQSQKIADAIGTASRDGKDELAGIAQVWAKGERGEKMPSRMVLSGHHVGSAVWGDGNGELSWKALQNLSNAMPNAAKQVEDVHIAACYSGGASKWNKYKSIFPNAKTIWAYSGSAPGAGSGATHHEAAWDTATRGRRTNVAGAIDRMQDRGWRKADNAVSWAAGDTGDYNGPSLDSLRGQVSSSEHVFESRFTGQQNVTDQQGGPLRQHYNGIQAMLQHPGLTGSERENLEGRRDQTIRTIFYDSHIKHRFQEAYGSDIGAGYSAMGMQAPDYGNLSRGDALNQIRQFQEAVANNPNPPAAATQALEHLNGLWNLDSQTIPQNWI